MDKLPRIKSVSVVPPGALQVGWKGGKSSLINLAGWIATGGDLLKPLLDPETFAHPRVAEYGAAVEWGEDEDLAIDAAHLELIAAEQQPFSAEHLAAWQDQVGLSNHEAAAMLGIAVSTWNTYKAGSSIPSAVAIACRAAVRDPLVMQAHYRPSRAAGRPSLRAVIDQPSTKLGKRPGIKKRLVKGPLKLAKKGRKRA